jgi:hypothetical protein
VSVTHELCVVDADGSDRVQITDTHDRDELEPSWQAT